MHVVALRHGRALRRRAPPIPTRLTLVVVTGSALLVLVADAVAGAGVGDARLLRPRRSRPHPVLAGRCAPALLRAHRGHGVLDRRDGDAAGRALHRRPGRARRPALARRLRRRRRHGRHGDRAGGRPHHRALPPDRPQAHPAGGADRGRRDRRGLRHRPAGRRDPLLRHALPHRLPGVGHGRGAGARRRQRRLVAGPRHPRRHRRAGRRARREFPPARRRHPVLRAALRAPRDRRRRHFQRRRAPAPRPGALSPAPRRRPRCAARNGRCCGAIPGCCRRR